jgi:hypothetical protein
MSQLLVRINQALLSYCIDTELYGDMPFSRYEASVLRVCVTCLPLYRTREEELIYILRRMLSMQLWTGSLWASRSETPSQFAMKQPGKTSQPPALDN